MKKVILNILNKLFFPLMIICICSLIFNKELVHVKYISIVRYVLLIISLIGLCFEISKLAKRK